MSGRKPNVVCPLCFAQGPVHLFDSGSPDDVGEYMRTQMSMANIVEHILKAKWKPEFVGPVIINLETPGEVFDEAGSLAVGVLDLALDPTTQELTRQARGYVTLVGVVLVVLCGGGAGRGGCGAG